MKTIASSVPIHSAISASSSRCSGVVPLSRRESFGRIVDLKPDELLTDLAGAEALVAAEPEIIAHMNADHAETCRLYATKLLGAADGDWHCVGCDPEGLDLQSERTGLRLPFPQRVTQPGVLRAVLKQMADKARSKI